MMTKLRLWIAFMLAWLFVLYNIERIHEPINLASFVYVLCGFVATVMIVFPSLQRLSSTWVIGTTILVMIAIKAYLGYHVMGSALPLTVTESFVLALTLVIAKHIGRSIGAFESGALELATSQDLHQLSSLTQQQNEMYREVRRARTHNRPLSLMTLRTANGLADVDVNRLLLKTQRSMILTLVNTRIVQLLVDKSDCCAVVAHDNNKIHVMLPELEKAEANKFAEMIRKQLRAELGLEVEAGLASFPNEEVTLTGLIARASERMLKNADTLETAHIGNERFMATPHSASVQK